MNKIVILVVYIFAHLFSSVMGQSIQVWYQPTSYPLKKYDGTPMPTDIKIIHAWDGWFNNSDTKSSVRDEKLQIGGYGDIYCSPMKFDLTGLPLNADESILWLYLYQSGSVAPSQVSIYRIDTEWSPTTVGWERFPYVNGSLYYYWPVSPSTEGWRGHVLTGWYNDWKSGVYPDRGLLLWPENNNAEQRFDRFVSSRSTASFEPLTFSKAPVWGFRFTPTIQLQLPLPGKHKWMVTTEIGGYDCIGKSPWPDTAHQGENYFSVDFSWRNIPDAGATIYKENNDIPVIAAGGGVVLGGVNYNSTDLNSPNGYFVVVDHDFDGNVNTGFTSRYLHLKKPPAVSSGNKVAQGDLLGYMGNTGMSSGTHLHFGLRYNNSGASTVSELSKALLTGQLLKSYQTACEVDADGIPKKLIRYYRSDNKPY